MLPALRWRRSSGRELKSPLANVEAMRPVGVPLAVVALLLTAGSASALRAPGDPYELAEWFDQWGAMRTEILPHNAPTDLGVIAVEQPIAYIAIYSDLGMKRHDGEEVRAPTPMGDVALIVRQDYFTPTLVAGYAIEDENGQRTTEYALLT